MNLSLDERIAGVLVPVFAVRGKEDLGIGDTWSLREFVDWAAEHGFRLVKILPINETGGDHSPYNAISSVALEPTTIRTSPEAIRDLAKADYETALREVDPAKLTSQTVDYSTVKPLKRRLLEAAFARFKRTQLQRKTRRAQAFLDFIEKEKEWLDDYALFRVLMDENGGSEQWSKWREEHRSLESARGWLEALRPRARRATDTRLQYFKYVQWLVFIQWREVKQHAEGRGVALMGDIPFGVSYYSADVWAQPQLFRRNWCGGTPPDRIFKHDAFVQKWGQNWGIPLYDWDAMRVEGFRWWRQRVRGVREFFHLFRIDHVLGFYRIYGFPWRPEENGTFLPLSEAEARERTHGVLPGFQARPDDTPEHRDQNRRDGEEYLRPVLAEAGAGRVIGEDLGEVPDYVRPSLTAMGIAGYKIPQWEKRPDGSLIPGGDYQRLSLTTYGTHDHDPVRAMWEQLAKNAEREEGARQELRVLSEYAGIAGDGTQPYSPEIQQKLLRALFASNSWIAVVMITDIFGRTERFNFPGVASSENWTQRMHAPVAELNQDPASQRISDLLRETKRAH